MLKDINPRRVKILQSQINTIGSKVDEEDRLKSVIDMFKCDLEEALIINNLIRAAAELAKRLHEEKAQLAFLARYQGKPH